jgi:hypothetical protein
LHDRPAFPHHRGRGEPDRAATAFAGCVDRAYLDRIAAIDPQLNAYLLATADQALD